MGVKISGMDQFAKAIAKAAQFDSVKKVVKLNGAELQTQAQKKVPVGTPESTGIPGYKGGTLRRSIGLEIVDEGLTAEVEAGAHYSGYVEYGTRFMNARPYLRPAYESQKVQFMSDLKKLGLE